VLIPLDAEVESAVALLFVDDRPLEIDVTPLCAAPIPLDADVESTPTELFVVDKPVESELTPL